MFLASSHFGGNAFGCRLLDTGVTYSTYSVDIENPWTWCYIFKRIVKHLQRWSVHKLTASKMFVAKVAVNRVFIYLRFNKCFDFYAWPELCFSSRDLNSALVHLTWTLFQSLITWLPPESVSPSRSWHKIICVDVCWPSGAGSKTARVLLLMVIPGQVIFMFAIKYLQAGHDLYITAPFAAVYLTAAFVQVSMLSTKSCLPIYRWVQWVFNIDALYSLASWVFYLHTGERYRWV